MRYDLTPSYTMSHKTAQLLDVIRESFYKWKFWHGYGSTRVLSATGEYHHVAKFLDLAHDTKRMTKHVHKLLTLVVNTGGAQATAVLRACSAFAGSVPNECWRVVRAGKTFDQVEEKAARLHAGITRTNTIGAPTMIELAGLLGSLADAQRVCPDAMTMRLQLATAAKALRAEFDVMSASHTKRIRRYQAACEATCIACDGIVEACQKWSFEKVPWVLRKPSDADKVMVANRKLVESFGKQFDCQTHC